MNELVSSTIKPEWRLERGAIFLRLPRTPPAYSTEDVSVEIARRDVDSHVRLYWRLKARQPGISPRRFVQFEARAQGIDYEMLISREHLRAFYRQRKTVLLKLMRRFPRLTTMQLGALLHRHHTSILNMLVRTATAKQRAAKMKAEGKI